MKGLSEKFSKNTFKTSKISLDKEPLVVPRINKRKKIKGQFSDWSSKEVRKLTEDEGILHLLTALPSSRKRSSVLEQRRNTPSSFSQYVSKTNKISSSKSLHTTSTSRGRGSGRGRSLKKNKSSLKNDEKMETEEEEEEYTLKKACSDDFHFNDKIYETLQSLPKTEIQRLLSSPSRYSLSSDPHPHENEYNEFSLSHIKSKHIESSLFSTSFKDILIRKYPLFVQIILAPVTTLLKNTMNANVIEEIIRALSEFEADTTIRAVLVSGLGNVFCNGIDLSLLTFDSRDKQRKNAESLARGIQRLTERLLHSSRLLLIACVNGRANGLAVSLLPLFDIVYASDNATFEMPYAKLGMIPEAGGSLSTNLLMSEMTLLGKKSSAIEAQRYGLVTSILWPEKFFEQIVPKLQKMEHLSNLGIKVMKNALKAELKIKILNCIEDETETLIRQWTTPEFVSNVRQYLRSACFIFQ